MSKPGRQPDYQLHAMNKSTDEKARVGAAWTEDDGRISIKLNSFTQLSAGPDLVLSLFPVNDKDRERWAKERAENKRAGHNPDGSAKPF